MLINRTRHLLTCVAHSCLLGCSLNKRNYTPSPVILGQFWVRLCFADLGKIGLVINRSPSYCGSLLQNKWHCSSQLNSIRVVGAWKATLQKNIDKRKTSLQTSYVSTISTHIWNRWTVQKSDFMVGMSRRGNQCRYFPRRCRRRRNEPCKCYPSVNVSPLIWYCIQAFISSLSEQAQ